MSGEPSSSRWVLLLPASRRILAAEILRMSMNLFRGLGVALMEMFTRWELRMQYYFEVPTCYSMFHFSSFRPNGWLPESGQPSKSSSWSQVLQLFLIEVIILLFTCHFYNRGWFHNNSARDLDDERLSASQHCGLLWKLPPQRQAVDLYGILWWRFSSGHIPQYTLNSYLYKYSGGIFK